MINTLLLLDKNGLPSSRKLTAYAEALRQATYWMQPTATMAERLWILHHGFTEYPKKCHCGAPVRWSFWRDAYKNNFCSTACWQDARKTLSINKTQRQKLTKEERLLRQETSNLSKYGVRWPWMLDAAKKDRAQSTKIKSAERWMNQLQKRNITPLFTVQDYIDGKASRAKLPGKCSCGTVFTLQRYVETKAPDLCPSCYTPRASRWQHEVNDFVRAQGVKTRLNDRKTLGGKFELDIYIPELNTAVECDGTWFHSEGGRPDIKQRLHAKRDKCAEAGITLIQIFDFEWDEKQDVVKGLLKFAIEKNAPAPITDLAVRQLPLNVANDFFLKTHIEGTTQGTVFGLYLNSKLISAIALNHLDVENDTVEIVRISSLPGIDVYSSLTKLFKHVVKSIGSKKFIGYANNRFCDSKIYEHLGFTQFDSTDFVFFYVNSNGKRMSQYEFYSLKKDHDDKEQKFLENAWHKVWTPGSTKWCWVNTN